MNTKFKSALIAILILVAGSFAMADISVGIRTSDFYLSVGHYDYYPYGVPEGYTPRISFYDVMSDYGSWVYIQPFGRVWRPYVDAEWRPYVYGHWIYTQYGPTWQGYEPWAWVGYHYGDWVLTQEYGWVWIPGYDWYPAHVVWSYGTDSIGWMPAPPVGYDYYEGSIRFFGRDHVYSYDYDTPYGYGYGRPVVNINVNLWIFINNDHYRSDNYADYCLDRNHTQELFTRKAVRISSQPFERTQLERIVKQKVEQIPVEVREVQTERKAVRMVIPSGEAENIRKNANRVVQGVIKPAFVKQHRDFKGQDAQNEKAVETIFKQKPAAQPKNPVQVSNEKDVRSGNSDRKNRDTQFETPNRTQDVEKKAPKAGSDNNGNLNADRNYRYQAPPQKNPSEVNGNDYKQPGRPDINQDKQIDSRNRDTQFDKNATKGSANKVDSSDKNPGKDSKVIREQGDSRNQTKPADQKKNSDQKNQKDKKKNNDDTPNNDRRFK